MAAYELLTREETLKMKREIHEARLLAAETEKYRGWQAVADDARKCLAKIEEWEKTTAR